MKKTLKLQANYSAIENGYQLWIPLDCSIRIPEDDPVRLLNAVAERMNYRAIEAAYSRYGRIEYSPKILTKILIYGYMRMIISTRKLNRPAKRTSVSCTFWKVKLHFKIQKGRLGTALKVPESFPAGL